MEYQQAFPGDQDNKEISQRTVDLPATAKKAVRGL
jgi:hypothetical protein